MAERFYALGDIGGTNFRVGVYNGLFERQRYLEIETDPRDYEGTVQKISDTVDSLADERGKIVAASIAVAAEVSESGVLTKSGTLHAWIGKNLGKDLCDALMLPEGLVGTPNDVVAVAISQQKINASNGRPMPGLAASLSTGFNDALYGESDWTASDEAGHEHLRPGAKCPCGKYGHVEAYISGKGVEINHGVSMAEWLQNNPKAASLLVEDLTSATAQLIERHRSGPHAFTPREIRWTGGVALGHLDLIQRMGDNLREIYPGLAIDTASMGHGAGLHGTFIDAGRRAANY